MASKQRPILIAEDDENDVILLRRAIRDAGVKNKVVVTCDGYQVVDYLEGQPPYSDRRRYPMPGLIILDIKMRLMDGFEVLAWVQTRPDLQKLPAVILTGSSDERDRKRALELGALDYRVKPQKNGQLTAVLNQWERRFLKAERPAKRSVAQKRPVRVGIKRRTANSRR
jgi:CheY-like chemotaxis protein